MSALDTLVQGLFDYAGMFPPASLGIEEALHKAATFPRTLRRPHLVGADAVLAFAQLEKLDAQALTRAGFARERQVRVAVLGAPIEGTGDQLAGQARALVRMATPRSGTKTSQPPPVLPISLEVKWPCPAGNPVLAAHFVRALSRSVTTAARVLAPSRIRLYVEPEWLPADCPSLIAPIVDALVAATPATSSTEKVGLKIRGSGPTAVDPGALASIIGRVVESGIPFKATAGLHHPIIEQTRYGNALGFLNVAGTLRLVGAIGTGRLGEREALRCLTEADPSALGFLDGRFAWRDHSIGIDDLRRAMAAIPFSIGSCSIDEPDTDLVRLFGPA